MSAEIPPVAEKFEPNYELNEQYIHELCAEFLATRTDGFGPEQNPYPDIEFKCFLISGKNRFSNLGRYVESKIFGLEHTFKNSPETMKKQYGPYEDFSTFFVNIHGPTQMPMGVMRLIENSPQGLKTLNDLADPSITGLPEPILPEQICQRYAIEDLDKCIDIATLAVMEEDLRISDIRTILLGTYRDLFLAVINNPTYTHMLNISTTKLYSSLRGYHFPFVPITEPFSYLDETEEKRNFSIAIVARNEDFQPDLTRYKNRYRATARNIRKMAQLSGNENTAKVESLMNQAARLQYKAYFMEALVAEKISDRNLLDRGVTQEVRDLSHNKLPLSSIA